MERSTDHKFYQDAPRPVGAMAVSFPNGFHEERHSHPRAELLCAESGTVKVTTDQGAWIVPPHRAVWIPPHYLHESTALGAVRMHVLFVRADACPASAPREPRVIPASPLLRELVRRAAAMPIEYDESGHEGKVVALLLGEIQWTSPHYPAMPTLRDSRLLVVERALAADPGDTRTLDEWANLAGASSRTLGRLFVQETGMSFRCWREQFRALTAISRLMEGVPITALASDCGYETPGAFTAMFKRVMGVTPSQLLSETFECEIDYRLRT